MKVIIPILLLISISASLVFAQENMGTTRYFDERAKGDAAADSCRRNLIIKMKQSLKSGETSGLNELTQEFGNNTLIRNFQNNFKPATLNSEKRIIGKYCRGEASANKYYPMIVFTLAKTRLLLNFAKETNTIPKYLVDAAKKFHIPMETKNFLLKLKNITFPSEIYMDYWGYFIQIQPTSFKITKQRWIYTLEWQSNESTYAPPVKNVLVEVLNTINT